MNRYDRTVLAGALVALHLGTAMAWGADPATLNSPIYGLRCEYLSNPLGIDVAKPRLSWLLNPAGNVAGQSAYRVLVASSPAILKKDQGDLWDSGRVTSAQTAWVEYGGKPLASGQQAFWKVHVWTDASRVLPWSAQANWSMGILRGSDWHGKFIGERRPDGVAEGTPLPFPWLRKTVDLKQKPVRAVAYVNALGYYELYVNGKKVDDHVLSPPVSDFSKRTMYVAHEIADYLTPGKNVVALWLGRGWYVKGHPGVIHDGPLVRAQFLRVPPLRCSFREAALSLLKRSGHLRPAAMRSAGSTLARVPMPSRQRNAERHGRPRKSRRLPAHSQGGGSR